jgi:hypothetical protein
MPCCDGECEGEGRDCAGALQSTRAVMRPLWLPLLCFLALTAWAVLSGPSA